MPKEVGATRIHVISDKMEKEQFIKHRSGFMASLLHRESIVIVLSHSISYFALRTYFLDRLVEAI